MIIQQKYSCELCGKIYAERDAVRNGVYIDNGESNRNYVQVCDGCTKRTAEVLDSSFLKNKYNKVEVN